MMRKLNKEEEELTKIGLEKNKKELKELKDNLAYNLALLEKQKYLRNFDAKWRDYLQKQKDVEDEKVFQMIKAEIRNKEDLIKTANTHLKDGVEVKMPSGV